MFSEYQKEVVDTYLLLRETNALSLNLIYPTPARIKEECMNTYLDDIEGTEEQTFRLIFGSKGNQQDYFVLLARCDIDKFKPLVNFMKGKTTKTDPKNIELLAWLIKFEPRPYQKWNRLTIY